MAAAVAAFAKRQELLVQVAVDPEEKASKGHAVQSLQLHQMCFPQLLPVPSQRHTRLVSYPLQWPQLPLYLPLLLNQTLLVVGLRQENRHQRDRVRFQAVAPNRNQVLFLTAPVWPFL